MRSFPAPQAIDVYGRIAQLAGDVFDASLAKQAGEASKKTIAGFSVLREMQFRTSLPSDYAEWIVGAIEKALPKSMALALDLLIDWGPGRIGRLDDASAREVSDRIISWSRTHFNANMISDSLGISNPFTLNHFIRQVQLPGPSQFVAERWSWIAPHLTRAMEIRPHAVTPQVCILLTRDDPAARLANVHSRSRSLDEELIVRLAPDQDLRRVLLNALSQAPDPSVLPRDLPMSEESSARDEAIRGAKSGAESLLATWPVEPG
jgi:hypothetical protein